MPPHDPGGLKEDFQQLLEAWKNGPENTPDCDWIIPPAGDCESRVVGDDYRHKAKFNRPNENELNKKPVRVPRTK